MNWSILNQYTRAIVHSKCDHNTDLHVHISLYVRRKTVEHLLVAPEQSQGDESVHLRLVITHTEGVHQVHHDGGWRPLVLLSLNQAASRPKHLVTNKANILIRPHGVKLSQLS